MDEMRQVRELVRDTPLRDLDELAPLRGRLAVAMSEERVSDERPVRPVRHLRPVQRSRPGRRFALSAAAAVAGLISAVIVLAPDQIGGQVPAANAEAAKVLHSAAAAALKLPDVEPRPDQFVYQRSGDGSESWMSVDGTRDGFTQRAGGVDKAAFPGCRDGRRASMKGDVVTGTEVCTPQPAYLPDLPTDADAMLAYLSWNRSGEPGDANAIGKEMVFLLEGHYLRPRSKAALFEAAARVPGLSVIRDATDAAGRPGVGIGWSAEGRSGRIIFDAETYAYLGVSAGQGSSTVVQVAIVDEVGQRP